MAHSERESSEKSMDLSQVEDDEVFCGDTSIDDVSGCAICIISIIV